MNMPHHNDHNDPAISALERALDTEARSFRSAPDAGFEARLARAAQSVGPPAVVGRIQPLHHRMPFRLAAGLGVALTVGIGGYALLGTPAAPPAGGTQTLSADIVAAQAEAAFAELFADANSEDATGLWAIGASSDTAEESHTHSDSLWDIGTSDALSDLTLEDLL